MIDKGFWNNRCVFITGHTGFKGSWLCRILANAGANVTGYALASPTEPNLFSICGIESKIASIIGDIRDRKKLVEAFGIADPEIVIHMAAQPIVRDGYKEPAYTYDVNVMGTVNILECVRLHDGVESFLNVTTDKVYRNSEIERGYVESDILDGFDPYSNSKSCSELITGSYRNAFFNDRKTAISTARSGNVIGGGDFSSDRIIPDCISAAEKEETIVVRNPSSTRPYQHVLEPLFAYLLILQKQYEDWNYAGAYNVGPDDCDCISTGTLADLFCKEWGCGLKWEHRDDGGPHEAGLLKLDSSKIINTFGWRPRWNAAKAVAKTVEWTKARLNGENICDIMDKQIEEYLNAE